MAVLTSWELAGSEMFVCLVALERQRKNKGVNTANLPTSFILMKVPGRKVFLGELSYLFGASVARASFCVSGTSLFIYLSPARVSIKRIY